MSARTSSSGTKWRPGPDWAAAAGSAGEGADAAGETAGAGGKGAHAAGEGAGAAGEGADAAGEGAGAAGGGVTLLTDGAKNAVAGQRGDITDGACDRAARSGVTGARPAPAGSPPGGVTTGDAPDRPPCTTADARTPLRSRRGPISRAARLNVLRVAVSYPCR